MLSHQSTSTAGLRILQSVRLGGDKPSYMDHVAARLDPARDTVLPFSYRQALTGQWDVLHMHWPEYLIRHRNRGRRILRSLLFALLVLRVRIARRGVVRTLHNVMPHERGRSIESVLLRAMDRRVTHYVRLNDLTPVRDGVGATTIPHGHYRDESHEDGDRPADHKTFVFFGYLRPYKGVDALARAFARLEDRELRLVIAGEPASDEMRAQVEAIAAADPRVEVHLEFLAEEQLATVVQGGAVVVLPYREIHNSGVVFAALSMGRPVLVPENEVTANLRSDVGQEWVLGFQPPLCPADLRAALDLARSRPPGARPRLDGRDWASVAEAYSAVYRRSLGRAA